MSIKEVITALELPSGSLLGQRIPKKYFLENGAPTSADKQLLNDGIEEVQWVAQLRQDNCGVPSFRDAQREYLEIGVLSVEVRNNSKFERLASLIHRSIPYPLLLVLQRGDELSLTGAGKRWSQSDPGKTVLDGEMVSADRAEPSLWQQLLKVLSVAQLSRRDMFALYGSWLDAIDALRASKVTGQFRLADSPTSAVARRVALGEFARISHESDRARALALKEKQVAKQIELNAELKRLEALKSQERSKL